MARIVSSAHARDRFRERGYLIAGLFPFWTAAGHQVIVHEGAFDPPPGDIAFLHVDRTVVPEPYLAALRRYPLVVNGATADIGKRRISEHLVRENDPYDGPVIVKTNLNCAGIPEAFHGAVERREASNFPRLRAVAGTLRRTLVPSGARAHEPPYAVYPRRALVPPAVWRDPEAVVEKFLPERDERGYYVRVWLFCGDRETCTRVRGPHPVVKARDIVERTPVPVPDEMRERRRRLGFEFGKFDFVLHQGTPVLLDANRTPTLPSEMNEDLASKLRRLAPGLDALLRGPG